MRRVIVIGSGGAGKSTLARRIAARTGLPLVHLDTLYWRPGWQAMPHDEWDATIRELVAHDAWVIDGNYGRTLSARIAACDTIVFLDVPRRVSLWRIVRRRLQYVGRARPDIAPGCPEQLTWEFIWWVWTYPARRRAEILLKLDRVKHEKRVVVLRTNAELEHFVASLADYGSITLRVTSS